MVGVEVDTAEPPAFIFGKFHCPWSIQCIVVGTNDIACPRVVVEKLDDDVVGIVRRDCGGLCKLSSLSVSMAATKITRMVTSVVSTMWR